MRRSAKRRWQAAQRKSIRTERRQKHKRQRIQALLAVRSYRYSSVRHWRRGLVRAYAQLAVGVENNVQQLDDELLKPYRKLVNMLYLQCRLADLSPHQMAEAVQRERGKTDR